MEIHISYFFRAVFPRGFPRKFARCGSQMGLLDSRFPRASTWDKEKERRGEREGKIGGKEGRAKRIKGSLLILRPKRFPSVDYGNVALLQLAIRSLCLLAIRDIAVESDPVPFALTDSIGYPALSMRMYMGGCSMRWDRRFSPGHAINRELIKLAAIVLGNCWVRSIEVSTAEDDTANSSCRAIRAASFSPLQAETFLSSTSLGPF